MSEPFPADSKLTHILVVADTDRSRDFYRDVLGAKVLREYGGTSVVMAVTEPGSFWSPEANRHRTSQH